MFLKIMNEYQVERFFMAHGVHILCQQSLL